MQSTRGACTPRRADNPYVHCPTPSRASPNPSSHSHTDSLVLVNGYLSAAWRTRGRPTPSVMTARRRRAHLHSVAGASSGPLAYDTAPGRPAPMAPLQLDDTRTCGPRSSKPAPLYRPVAQFLLVSRVQGPGGGAARRRASLKINSAYESTPSFSWIRRRCTSTSTLQTLAALASPI